MLAPIVLFVYNRMEHTRIVVEHLAKCELAEKSLLYIISDGPKNGDEEKVHAVREYCKSIRGFEQIVVEEKEENWGIERSEVEAITRLIGKHGKLIILEDDLKVNSGFLKYMNEGLDRYEKEKRVFYIGGYMYGSLPSALPETMFLKMPSTWGWATWKDRWDKFEMPPRSPQKIYLDKEERYLYTYDDSCPVWGEMLEQQSKVDDYTWDVCWHVSLYRNGGLVLLPRDTMVYNIGFDGSGVHKATGGEVDSTWNEDGGFQGVLPKKVEEKKIYRKVVGYMLKMRYNRHPMKQRIKKMIMRSEMIDKIRYFRNTIRKINKIETELQHQKKLIPKATLRFEIHLAEHCNLNCRGCDNFSSIAEPTLLDLDILERDMKRLSELCGGVAKHIHLLGGEPLLHPDIQRAMRISRAYFPTAEIDVYTNGILLNQQTEDFWNTCKEQKVNIMVTKYPVNIDYETAERKAMDKGINFTYCNGREDVKKMFRMTMDTEGLQDELDSFLKCHRANQCITLKSGKMYTCTVIPNIEHYNKRFNENLVVTPRDYVDIYEVDSFEQMMEKLAKPTSFCRYCAIDADTNQYDWAKSKKEKSEWTL